MRCFSCLAILFWSVASRALAEEIPVGFKLDRYVQVWEHNPFALASPAAPQPQGPAFSKLFLTSWLVDGSQEVIFVQNAETNEVQRFTREPDQNNVRLVELNPSPDPHFVTAVISNGKEQGVLRFRVDLRVAAGETRVGPNQRQIDGPNTTASGETAMSRAGSPNLRTEFSSPRTWGPAGAASTDQPVSHAIYPGIPRVHIEGASRRAPRQPDFRTLAAPDGNTR